LNNTEPEYAAYSKNKDLTLLTKALDASISGVVITDNLLEDNPIIYCNKAFENITGYSREDIIGHNCRFLQSEDRNQHQREVIKNAVQNGENCMIEIRNYKKNGTLFYNELYLSPVKDDDGNVTHFIGIQNDITRRKEAELALIHQQEVMEIRIQERTRSLHENQNFLLSIIHTVRESLVVLDPDYKVITVNEHFIKTFKVTRNETEGKLLFDLGNGQWNIPALKDLLHHILPTNNPVEEFEVEHNFPHIGQKLMILNAHRIELEGQYKDQILIAIEDITDRKEIERRKDDFLSVASHELKTPLTTIKGLIQVVQKQVPENANEKFRSLIGKTGIHIDRLNNLISELLDVSRIQTGNIELHKETFDFDNMVKEAIEGIQIATKTHRITLEGSTGVNISADESHIIQVVTNLLSNAMKYAPESEQVVVRLAKVNDYIKLSVTDKGMGISFNDQKKIFDRFYRVGDVQKRFPGMGIGLYISDQIIKNHKGTLWVDSKLGKGSTFNFTLPLFDYER
jgi:PAS domain S-box-containing protein